MSMCTHVLFSTYYINQKIHIKTNLLEKSWAKMWNKKALSQKEPQTQYQAAPSTSIFLLPMQWKKILKERNNFLEIPVKSTSPNRSIIILEWNYSFFYYRYIHPVYLHCCITTYFYRLVLLVDGIFTPGCVNKQLSSSLS